MLISLSYDITVRSCFVFVTIRFRSSSMTCFSNSDATDWYSLSKCRFKMWLWLKSRSNTQCCGSGMFIPDPGSWFLPIPDPGSRIPYPKTATEERSEKKNCCGTFLCIHKFHKIENYFSFKVLKKKIWANFQRIIELFTQKIVTKLSKISVWDPGSGKNLFRIPESKRHRISDPDPQHW